MHNPIIRTIAFTLWTFAIGETIFDQVFSGRGRVIIAEVTDAKIKRSKASSVA